jgi:hypothetical protein
MTLVPYVALCWAAFSAGRGIAARTVALFGAIATSGILVLSFAL